LYHYSFAATALAIVPNLLNSARLEEWTALCYNNGARTRGIVKNGGVNRVKVPSDKAKSLLETAEWSWKLLDASSWADFEMMFDKHKGCSGGCWCVFHICPSATFHSLGREGRKALHRSMAEEGKTSGVICYLDSVPVGWCQFAPAPVFEQVNRGRAYREFAARDTAVPRFRITCVFVDKNYRRLGLAKRVLATAVAAIHAQGGGLTEAFPMEVPETKRPQYTGSVKMYEAEGFVCAARLGANHFVMRAEL
jgi:ribosomal protein S18 acetylase RimI-like enzyme